MVHSHHSHSGTYCCHATTSLAEMIQVAIDKKFKTFSLTEHVPRLESQYLYPEESHLTVQDLQNTFESYMEDARKFQKAVNSDDSNCTTILVGFESEGGINDDHLKMCLEYKENYEVDLVVGSVHHVYGIPIDFDRDVWNKVLKEAGGDISEMYYQYFKSVCKTIEVLKPEVVAHFDLIRLFTPSELDIGHLQKDERVWSLIEKAIDLIIEFDLLVELNSSAIRKGWETAYPKPDIFKHMVERGVKFCLSDDSHKADQIGLNYHKVLKYLQDFKVASLWYYTIEDKAVIKREMPISEFETYVATI